MRCENEEERCDICYESDIIIEELKTKRQVYIKEARKE